MMVSKLAVAALVFIVASPILLGYALSLDEVQSEYYEKNGDTVNVTPLIRKGISYDVISADPWTMNYWPTYNSPYYVKQTGTFTNIYQAQVKTTPGEDPMDLGLVDFLTEAHMVMANQGIDATVTKSDFSTETIINVKDISYTDSNKTLKIWAGVNEYTFVNATWVTTTPPAGYTGVTFTTYKYQALTPGVASTNGNYVDLTGGFKMITGYDSKQINMSAPTESLVMTIDLYYNTNSSFTIDFRGGGDSNDSATYYFEKNGSAWDVKTSVYENGAWVLKVITSLPVYGSTDSVYQIEYNVDNITFNYIGNWQSAFGKLNTYMTYGPFDNSYLGGVKPSYLSSIRMNPGNDKSDSPTIRLDVAMLRGNTYSVIENKTYDPASFRPNNPYTTISEIQKYGTSIEFGGHTYTVSNKEIQIGSHKVSLEGLNFNSVLLIDGTYDNRIGDTVISNTATPSTIVFNGIWSASVVTESQHTEIKTETKWVPGEFGFNGLDESFLMIGLLSSITAFVLIGMYGRRSGAKVLPLLIVCGGAAAVFFIMM